MSNPNKLTQFWQELKRRKVIRSLTVYAASAFIIIEAGDIVLPRLGFPDWTVTFLIVLIIVGFPVTIIFSWIFDLGPKGIEKTDSLEKATKDISSGTETDVDGLKKPILRLSNIINAALLILVIILLYPKIFKKDKFDAFRDEQGRITLAVMPFENLTGDTTLNYFRRGISSYLANDLGSSPQLAVRDEHSVFELTRDLDQVSYAGFVPSEAREMAQALKAETYLTGSFQGNQGNYLILVDLIDSNTGEKIWTNRVKGNLETSDYFDMADSLARLVKDYLEIEVMKKDVDKDLKEAFTHSSEAYKYFIEGMNAFLLQEKEHAIQALSKALDFDKDFTIAKFYMAWAYNPEFNDSTGAWVARAWENRENLPAFYQQWLESWHACFISKDIDLVKESCLELSKKETDSRLFWYDLGLTQLSFLDDFTGAVRSFEKVEQISMDRNDPWKNFEFYNNYVEALHESGNHEKEHEINMQGQRLYPGISFLTYREAFCAASLEDWELLGEIKDKHRKFWNEYGLAPEIQENMIGVMFDHAGHGDSAEVHLRKSLEMNPKNPVRIRALARILIKYDLDVKEGLELLQSISDPASRNDWFFHYHLGVGLLKMGMPEDALSHFLTAKDLFSSASLDTELMIRKAEKAIATGT